MPRLVPLVILLPLMGLPVGALAPPSGADVLDQVRRAYRPGTPLSERLVIAVDGPEGSSEQVARLQGDGLESYRLDLCQDPSCAVADPIVWLGESGEVHVRAAGRYLMAPGLSQALLLHLDTDLSAALIGPRLLAGDREALPASLAVAVDGPLTCPTIPARRCWLLSLEGTGGERWRLWSEVNGGRLSLVRFERPSFAGLRGDGGASNVVLEVRHQVAGELAAPVPQAPVLPAVAQGGDAVSHDVARDLPAFEGQVQVQLSTIEVRAVEPNGTPLAGLGTADFLLRVGSTEVPVTAVDWIPRGGPSLDGFTVEQLAEMAEHGITLDPGGRLVVFFVQAGLETVRLKGHRRMLHQAETLLDGLGVEDRAAVVSFDSHLKLRLDLTREHQEVAEQLRQAIVFSDPPEIRPGRAPSIARHADLGEWKRAATPERALELVGKALEPLRGEKLLVYLGWGLGRYTSTGVRLSLTYDRASEALRRAGVTVYVLDITDADFHSLEVGLQQVAADTGGVYEKTNRFPSQVAGRFSRALAGHYVLTFVPPEEGGEVEVSLRVPGRILTASRRTVTTTVVSGRDP